MKILFVSDVPLSMPTSGSEKVLYSQAVGLNKKNYDVYAITRNNKNLHHNNLDNVDGVNSACYSLNPQNLINFSISILRKPIKLFNKLVNNKKFSVYICHQPFTLFSLLIQKKLSGVPILYVFHSPNHEEYQISRGYDKIYKGFTQIIIRKIIEGYCLKKSQKIIVLSKYMKKKIEKIHKISEDKIIVNYGGVDLDEFKFAKNRSKIKRSLDFPAGKIHLLTVRNLEPRMGLDNLLKAIYILKDKFQNLYFIIGGEGPERGRLEKIVKNYGLNDHVRLTGYIPAYLLPQYYGAGDFFILPTRELEGFGLVTTESMACGTPVIGTPIGGTKEILSPFNPHFVFKNSSPAEIAAGIQDTLYHYFNDQNEYQQLRVRCRKYVEKNYSWERHLEQLISTISGIVSSDCRFVN